LTIVFVYVFILLVPSIKEIFPDGDHIPGRGINGRKENFCMKHYETLYLLNPDLSEDEYKGETSKFLEIIEKNKGEFIKTEEWGKRSLAYDVKKFDKGFYVLLDYCGDGGLVSEIERRFKLDEHVLKYQTLKLSDHADVEALRASVRPGSAEQETGESREGEESEIEEDALTEEDREEG